MENELKPVEDVQTQPEDVVSSKTEPDYKSIAEQALAIAEASAEKVAKAEQDRDNYKQGILAKDRKLKELKDQGYDIGEDSEEKVTLEAVAKLLDERLSQKKEEVSDSVKTINELKTALINRQGLPATPTGGSSEETKEPKITRWVDAPSVKERILSQGLDPEVVFANWKANQAE